MKRVGKWLLVVYIVQALVGAGIGVSFVILYGEDGYVKLERIVKHLEDVANAKPH